MEQYNIDRDKVYGSGYSGGGETMSLVMGKRPDLFTSYLHVSSKWDGEYAPEELEYIPEGYRQPSGHPGTLEKLTYQTW